MLSSQVAVTAEKYGFLKHDSYIDCSRLLSFQKGELSSVQDLQNNTRRAIERVVASSKLIEPVFKRLISGK